MLTSIARRLAWLTSSLLALSLAIQASANSLDTEPQTRSSPVIEPAEALKLEPFSGSGVHTYALEVPPGTGGLTPNLGLSYSTLTRGTEYGYGWTLNLSRIERSTRFGPPTYVDEQDLFELDGDLLVRDPSSPNTRFHKQRTDFSRVEFFPGNGSTSSYWQVTHTDGTRYLYGSRSAAYSRLSTGAGLGGSALRWSLDQVVDARGNSYTVDYECEPGGDATCSGDIGYVYPRRIRYSFRSGEAAPSSTPRTQRLIAFEWEPRGYAGEDIDRPTSFRSGFKVQIGRRLARVRVGLDSDFDGVVDAGEQIRRYEFAYAPKTSDSNPNAPPFSELASIQRYAGDETPFPSAANPRPTRFTYSSPGRGFSSVATALTTPTNPLLKGTFRFSFNSEDTTVGLWDMNGDGILDRVLTVPLAGQRVWRVSLGLSRALGGPGYGEVFDWKWCDSSQTCSTSVPTGGETELLTSVVSMNGTYRIDGDLVDMDGDGLPDRIRSTDGGDWTFRKNLGCAPPLGCRFGPPQSWTAPSLTTGGSGQTDGGARNINAIAVLTTGSLTTETGKSRLIDMNGDGRPDHLAVDKQHDGHSWLSINNGCSGPSGCGFAAPVSIIGDIENSRQVSRRTSTATPVANYFKYVWTTPNEIADINGDGLPDLISTRPISTQRCLETSFGNGREFMAWEGTAGSGYAGGARDCRTGSGDWVTKRLGTEHDFVGAGNPVNPATDGALLDVNGDGNLDRLEVTSTIDGSPPYQFSIAFGLGDGTFSSDVVEWGGPDADPLRQNANITRDTIDIDGDGLVDAVYTSTGCSGCSNYTWYAQFNPGPEGLLTGVETELGEKDSIEYKPSTDFVGIAAAAVEPPGATLVPSPHSSWVVSRVTRDDGRSGTEKQITTIGYAEARYDFALREPRGFRMVDATDSVATLRRSLYHQTFEATGLLESEATIASGATLQSHTIGWQTVSPQNENGVEIVGAVFSAPTLETLSIHVGASRQDRAFARQFDSRYGFPISEIDSGADGALNTPDDLTTTPAYEPVDTTNWFLRHPRTQYQQFAASGGTTTVAHEVRSYDRGLLTQRTTVRHNPITQATENLVESWHRDTYGNVDEYSPPSRDPSTPQVVTAWESNYSTFPATITRVDGSMSLATSYVFDPRFGTVTRKSNPRGYVECWDYDKFGRLDRRRDLPSGGSIGSDCSAIRSQFVYPDASLGDPNAQYLTTLNIVGGTTSLERREYFDGRGRTYREANQAAATPVRDFFVTARIWGNRGELTCESESTRAADPAVGTVTCESIAAPRHVTLFDALLRPTQRILRMPGGPTDRVEGWTEYSVANHDGLPGNEVVETHTTFGMANLVREIAKDPRGDVVSVKEGYWTTYLRRDPKGRIRLIDGPDVYRLGQSPELNLLAITYNSEGQRVRVGMPNSLTDLNLPPYKTYSYDPDGNVQSEVGATNPATQITYSYDGLGRLRFKDLAPTNSIAAPGPTDSVYTYDSSSYAGSTPGELVRAVTGSVATDTKRDLRGNLTGRRRTVGATAYAFAYSYDMLGRVIAKTNSYAPLSASWIARKYNGSLLSSVHLPTSFSGQTTWIAGNGLDAPPGPAVIDGIGYHGSGALQSLHYPTGGATTTHSFYPSDYRLSRILTTSPSATLQDIAYDYDTAGNVNTIQDSGGLLSHQFFYDQSHRLTGDFTAGTYAYPLELYGYDNAGNLTQNGVFSLEYGVTGGGAHGVHKAYDPSTDTLYTYQYDDNRNVTSRTSPTGYEYFDHSAANELLHYSLYTTATPTREATYTYDDSGARVTRVVTANGATTENVITVDPEFEIDLVRGKVKRHIFIGGRRALTLESPTGAGSPVSQLQYHPDHLGSNQLITDGTGAVVQRAFSKPFGEVFKVVNGAAANLPPSNRVSQYVFTDHHADVESGLEYFGARYYDPIVGRFGSADPELLGPTAGITFNRIASSPQYLDGYSYAINNPSTLVDRDGRWVETAWDLTSLGLSINAFRLEPGFWNGVGVVVDAVGVALPLVPSGVGAARFAISHGDDVVDAASALRHADEVADAARGAGRATTDFVTDATVKSRGKVLLEGTVDVRPTVEGIGSGTLSPRGVFENREGLLPSRPSGYYDEFLHPTPGVSGAGPQRIVRGQAGELFYTPDHYETFIPLN